MKNNTMKRALSLFLAILMIALAIPFTMLATLAAEDKTIPTTIEHAKMYSMYSDEYSIHTMYGSVEGMIDGDPYGARGDNTEYPYFYSDPYAACNTKLYIDSIDETRTYYGYAMFELNGMSKLDDVTIWLAADGHNASAAADWSNPKADWNINNAYDILVSTDGETWTLMGSYSNMCGTKSEQGSGFPTSGDALAEKTVDGYKRLGHKVALDGAEAKYVAVAVKEGTYSNKKRIVIGEVTVSGTTTTSAAAKKTPAEIYAEAKDGTLLHTVNFNDPSWSDDYYNSKNWNTYYKLSEDGTSVEQLLTADTFDGSNTKRAIWGGLANGEKYPLENDNKYTIYYDMKFGANNNQSAYGIQVDGTNTVLIDGAGNTYWYCWHTEKLGAPSDEDEKWTSKIGDKSVSATQRFAVEVDPETEKMTLYVEDSDGKFNKVRTLTYDGAYIESGHLLNCAIYIRNMGANGYAEISNLQIYKGLVAEKTATTIKNAKMFAMYDDRWALHPLYGSVEGMIDGDAYNTKRSKNSDWPYFYSAGGMDENDNLLPGAYLNTEMYISSIDETRTYYGYALFELDAMSTLSDVTVWLAADGHNASAAAAWSNPKLDWNINNAYDVLVSEDGETWTLMGEYDDMCGDETNKGAGFPSKFDDGYAVKTVDGYKRLGHKAYLGGITAKYVAVAVKECINETGNQIVIGEVTVTGLVSSESTEKTPAEIYAEAKDGDLLKTINFNGTYWSDDYNNSDNWNDYYIITDGGNTVKHGLYDVTYHGNNNKRAMWGGLTDDEVFPLGNDNKYTIYYDVKFGGTVDTFGCGIQVDGVNTLVVDGAGNSYWYMWNKERVGKSDNADENWANKTDKDITATQTFAVEVNPETEELTLYVSDSSGLFNKVRTLTYPAGTDANGNSYNAAWIESTLSCGIYVRSLSGKVYSTSNAVFSNLQIYKGLTAGYIRTATGASVRIDDPTGIRFKSQFRKDYIDSLRSTYGEDSVTIGMIIAPTDYLTQNGIDFEMSALDACDAINGVKYVKIDATTIHENDMYYFINCALVNIKAENYGREFSARAFIEVNGELYRYAEFDIENHSRSIAEVAERAYNDVKGTADSVYMYETTLDVGTTAYSPYKNRELLKTFFEVDTSTSLTVMTYNIRAYGDADSIWDQITGNYEGWAGRDVSYALETIIELSPDVVGLQEDDSNLYGEYKNVPALEQNYNRITDKGNGNEGNEILYKKGINLVSTGKVYYKELAKLYPDNENIANADFSKDTKGDNEAGRFFRWAILEKNGVQFLVVNTHLHYKASGTSESSDPINKNLRKAQATLIRLWLANSTEAAECANRIVMGDMNAQGDSQEMKYGLLNGTGSLNLAANDAIRKGNVGGTLVEEGFTAPQPWVYDHVFYNAEALVAVEYSVVDNYDEDAPTNYPSDHLPVIAKFTCK